MDVLFVGIDIAKASFAAVVRQQGQNGKARTFKNTAAGFAQFFAWLPDVPPQQLFACLEATGSYGQALAEALYARAMPVSVVNPLAVKRFAQAGLVRNQTDPVDAGILAEFCESKKPRLWQPPTPAQAELRALSRRLDDLQRMLQMERNRLAANQNQGATLLASLQRLIEQLQAEIELITAELRARLDQEAELKRQKELLMTIQGVGQLTAMRFLAELGDLRQFADAKQLAAYLGLTPAWKRSGTSVHSRPRLSKQGPAQVRHLLFMPAIVAKRFNPIVHAFCERLADARKSDMAIIGAAMHKLVHLMFGVVHTGRPFDPLYLSKQPGPS